jgi:hypothetical protein
MVRGEAVGKAFLQHVNYRKEEQVALRSHSRPLPNASFTIGSTPQGLLFQVHKTEHGDNETENSKSFHLHR